MLVTGGRFISAVKWSSARWSRPADQERHHAYLHTMNEFSLNLKLLRLRCCCLRLRRNHGHISSPQPEQDLAAAIRFQRLLERFLELVKGVDMLHCGGERSISYEVSQLLVNLLD